MCRGRQDEQLISHISAAEAYARADAECEDALALLVGSRRVVVTVLEEVNTASAELMKAAAELKAVSGELRDAILSEVRGALAKLRAVNAAFQSVSRLGSGAVEDAFTTALTVEMSKLEGEEAKFKVAGAKEKCEAFAAPVARAIGKIEAVVAPLTAALAKFYAALAVADGALENHNVAYAAYRAAVFD